ncbi:MAG: hypothetical protein ACJ72H_05250 [Candidatus Sulfotelmatobacter sp.]|jgi:hypothetical protein
MPLQAGDEGYKSKNREESMQQIRRTLADLEAKYGTQLGGKGTTAVTEQAKRLQLPQKLLNNQTSVIPCRAELSGVGIADPALILPASWPVELLPPHKQLAVGGQVSSIARSSYSLPPYIMDAAWRSRQVWQGSLMPIVVLVDGESNYLVRANSWFFRSGKYRGQDIDPSFTNEPVERDLKRGSYHWGDDMSNELTIVVAAF